MIIDHRSHKQVRSKDRQLTIKVLFSSNLSHALRHISLLMLVALMSYPVLLVAQEVEVKSLYHIKYTQEDGLPMVPILNILSDSRGSLWLATAEGVGYFDGDTYTKLSSANLTNPVILLLDEDTNGNIWALSIDSKVYKVESDGLLLRYDIGVIDTNITMILWRKVTEFEVVSESDIHIGTRSNYLHIKDGQFYMNPRQTLGLRESGMMEIKGDKLFSTSNCKPILVNRIEVRFGDTLISVVPNLNQQSRHPEKIQVYTACTDGSFAISIGIHLYVYKDGDLKSLVLPSPATNSLTFVDDTTLYVGTYRSGICVIKSGSIDGIIFPDLKVISMSLDHEGGIWLGTEGRGIYYIPDASIEWVNKTPIGESIIYLKPQGRNIFSINSKLQFCMDFKPLPSPSIDHMAINAIYPAIYEDSFSVIFSIGSVTGTAKLLYIQLNDFTYKLRQIAATPLHLEVLSGDTFVSGYSGFIKGLPNSRTESLMNSERNIKRCMAMLPVTDSVDEFWMATMLGIIKARFDTASRSFSIIEQHHTSLSFDNIFYLSGELFAAAKSKPLFQYDKNSGKFIPRVDWGEFNISSFSKDGNTVVLSTQNGLVSISKRDNSSDFKVINLSNQLGLGTGPVHALAYNTQHYFIAQDEGVLRIPRSKILSPKLYPPKVYIKAISIEQQRIPGLEVSSELYNGTNIIFEIGVNAFKSRNHRIYQYRILPIDSVWRSTHNQELVFYNLEKNNYRLELRSDNQTAEIFEFSVLNHFYQDTWFLVMLTVLVVLFMALPLLFRIQLKHERIRFENEQNSLKLRSLTAQLNPHFVFNALSSIQSFILKNDTRSSNDYLAKFAQHIRQSLLLSSGTECTMYDSLESIRTYLELEKIRHNHSFEFNIEIEPDIDPGKIMIPAMLIQPYVENAVIHGMQEVEHGGLITISVSYINPQTILILIKDNGRGINNQSKSKGLGIGTTVNRQRIELLNRLQRGKYDVKLNSMHSEPGYAVSITINNP